MVEKVLIKKLIKEKLKIVQPACLPTVRHAGRQVGSRSERVVSVFKILFLESTVFF
jgi:hypothetical protein